MAEWWGTRSNVSPRLRLEVELMRATYADTFKLNVPRKGLLFWQGMVEINLKGLKRRDHILKIVYPAVYPNRPPEAYILEPYIYSEKHQFEDGQLCLFNPKDGITYGWNPSTSTAVTVVSWAIQWLYSFYTWKATGKWPGKEESIDGKPTPPTRPPWGRG
jgi:ubiquitin-protein ligase